MPGTPPATGRFRGRIGAGPIAARGAGRQPLAFRRGRLPTLPRPLPPGLSLRILRRLRLGPRCGLRLRLRLELGRGRRRRLVTGLEARLGRSRIRRLLGVCGLFGVGGLFGVRRVRFVLVTNPLPPGRRLLTGRDQRLLGHVDDGVVGPAGVVLRHRRHPVAGHPIDRGVAGVLAVAFPLAVGALRLRLGLGGAAEGRAVREVGVEQDFQAGPQGGKFRAQLGQIVGGLGAQLGGQLAAQLGLDGQLVFTPGRDLAVQLQVVDELEVADAGLIGVALAPIEHGNEGAGDCGPQRQDHSELEEFHPIGENQRGTGPDREDQQRCQEHPPRPAAAAPHPGAAGQNGHGLRVPAGGQSACRAAPAILARVTGGVASEGDPPPAAGNRGAGLGFRTLAVLSLIRR
ncbi:hypothetical protein MYSE111917_23685 [Mycobacterium senriense]